MIVISNRLERALNRRLKEYCRNPKVRKRWAKLIIERAVRFYCNSDLDIGVAEEDLYIEDRRYVNLEFQEKEKLDM